jgi:hypothetical protein
MRRIMAAAAERSAAYDEMLSEQTSQKLFGCGAFFLVRQRLTVPPFKAKA